MADSAGIPCATVLFVCRGNSVRSKIAAAFAERLLGDRAVILSAGIAPKAAIKPGVQQVMEEYHRLSLKGVPMPVTAFTDQTIDLVVTLSEEEPDPRLFSARTPRMVRWQVNPPSEAIGAQNERVGTEVGCSACELSDSAKHAKAVYIETAARIEQLVRRELPPLLDSLAS
mmetsp:Transcript_26223/g.46637  ORF Transcript_26223/g.46637 Transcript_26223/m.46637 type:complete len:171 (-) Transcript_26223:85-597(-)|eukprot:CAMPEP_0177765468 /NCGR_PEP_ID=MMETSP0491_2-20121128/8009_1 /TAXON_ID=63592 /ORGANISM="Tetraselmis chuii, Strain PLY429" /LENGTH=170 /DNA_ID=CAMNT_0019281821 /DNA_START=210 /DNA_END=722 /DNA_ORIENTATION=-